MSPAYNNNNRQQRSTTNRFTIGQRRPSERPPFRSSRPTAPRRAPQRPVDSHRPADEFVPKPARGDIRIMAFGGVSEIGKNMYAVEYMDTVVLLECGTMFGESTTPGIDSIMPNIEYLKKRKRDIKAVVLTDSSMTHIGAVPYTVHDIGDPTVYARAATKEVLSNWQDILRKKRPLTVEVVEKPVTAKISDDVSLQFFGIRDETPCALGVIIETKAGCVVYTGNLQVRNKNGAVSASEEELFGMFGDKTVLATLSDSVNAERPGFSKSDDETVRSVLQAVKESPSRTVLPLFPSQIKRNCMIADGAAKLGKRIYIRATCCTRICGRRAAPAC